MGIAILSSKGSSPYSVGATELDKAKKKMAELSKLKVTKDTYSSAKDTKEFFGLFTNEGDGKAKGKIEKQTKLENEISKNLRSIAAMYARDPDAVSPKIMKEARDLSKKLEERRVQDWDRADQAGADSYASKANEGATDALRLHTSLKDMKKDAIPLDETQSFIAEFRKEEKDYKDVLKIYQDANASESERDEAFEKANEIADELLKKFDLMTLQTGVAYDPATGIYAVSKGIADHKTEALPNGDAFEKAYEKQDKALTDLQLDVIFRPSEGDSKLA